MYRTTINYTLLNIKPHGNHVAYWGEVSFITQSVAECVTIKRVMTFVNVSSTVYSQTKSDHLQHYDCALF